MVQYLLELSSRLPSSYRWKVSSLEDFRERIAKGGSADDVNRIYWHDMARSVEAYGVIVMWRTCELMGAALRLLNSFELLAPAILSRSLIELASAIIFNGNIIRKTVTEAIAKPRGVLVAAPGLEKIIIRMLHGTRLADPSNELKQTNALTCVKHL